MSSREAHVRDIAGWDPTGANDMTSGYQNLINQAAIDGVPVVGDGFLALLGSPITLPAGHVFRGLRSGGDGGRSIGATPVNGRSSTFLIGHTGKGFQTVYGGPGVASGRYQEGIVLTDLGTRRNQPPVVTGQAWQPTDHDYDFAIEDRSDVHFERVHMSNATRGIKASGDRHTYKSITGAFFKNAFSVDWSYDVMRLEDWHVWPFAGTSPEIRAFTEQNLDVFKFARADGAELSRLFSIFHRRFISIDWFPGDGDANHPAGTTYLLQGSQLYSDIGQTSYYVAPAAAGHTASIFGLVTQGLDTPASNQPCLDIQADDVVLKVAGLRSARSGSSAVNVSGARAQVSIEAEISAFGLNAPGSPAITTAQASSRVNVLDGSRILGTPVFGGAGRTQGAGVTSQTIPVFSTAGTLPSTNASYIYTLSNDDHVDFSITIPISTIGTAGGGLYMDLPLPAAASSVFIGREVAVTGQSLSAYVAGNEARLYIQDDDNNFPAANGALLLISGRYRTTE